MLVSVVNKTQTTQSTRGVNKHFWSQVASQWERLLQTKAKCVSRQVATWPGNWQCHVLLCGDRYIRTLNANHRHKDKVTDVLSFPQFHSLRQSKAFQWPAEVAAPVGDIVVCMSQCRRQSLQHQIPFELELTHLLHHGFLHLLGYDHEVSAKEEKIMQSWESKLVSQLFPRQK